ncbi:MAG: hypothetical protein ACE5LA_03680 [Dehalococcoidales bacterium]
MAKRTSILQKLRGFLRGFFRGFLTTEELLPLTLEDICRVCPMTRGRGNHSSPEVQEKMEQCRKRYFAALLQSFLGKPGDYETDWLYSYLKKCEGCYLRRFAGAEAAEISIEADGRANVEEALPRDSQVSQEVTRDN